MTRGLEARWGPQWAEVAWIVDRARRLTADEIDRLYAAARLAARAATFDAHNSALAALAAAGLAAFAGAFAAAAAARTSTLDAHNFALDAYAAAAAVGRAALAVATRHLIGTAGYTQEHYDALIGPWLAAVGEIGTAEVAP